MDRNAARFSKVVRAGVVANLAIAAFALAAPGVLLRVLGLDQAIPDVWVRFSAWLLGLLSLQYLPAAADPYRSATTSWLTVGARWAGVAFFLGVTFALQLDRRYLLFAAFDLLFAIPLTIFLSQTFAVERQPATTSPIRGRA